VQSMDYRKLVEVYKELEKTTKRLEKVEIISNFLKKSENIQDIKDVVYLLEGRVFPEWDERQIGISSQLMLKIVNQSSGENIERINKLWKKEGDLGKVIEVLFSNKKQTTLFRKKLSINKVVENIRKIPEFEGKGTVNKKIQLVVELLNNSDSDEARFIVNTVLENLRLGVALGIIRDSIAKSFNKDVKIIESKYNLITDYGEIAELARDNKLDNISMKVGRPIKVMLAIKLEDIKEAFDALGRPAQCLPKGSAVYSNPKIVNIEEFVVGDKVIGLNGKFQKVTKVFKRRYGGPLVSITPTYLMPFDLTPEHRILTIRTNKCSWSTRNHLNCRPNCREQKYGCRRLYKKYRLEWVKALDLNKDHFLVFPKFKETSKFNIDMSKFYDHKLQYEQDKVRPFYYNKNVSWIKRFIKLNKNFFELMGWYLAEGCLTSDKRGVYFSLSKKELEESKRIKYLLKKVFSLKADIKERDHHLEIACHSIIFGEFLRRSFSEKATKKVIPHFILYSEPDLIKEFILSYVKGDGNIQKDRIIVSTSSRDIAFQLSLLLTKLDIFPYIREIDNSKGFGNNHIYHIIIFGEQINKLLPGYYCKRYHRQRYWCDNNYFYIPISKLSVKPFNGFVYNLETGDNSYLVSTLVHNCEYKLDGFRLNIHKIRDKISLFTRNLEDVTEQFEEIIEVINKYVKAESFILDCEAVGYDPKTGKYLPFQSISQRIKRKYDIKEMAKKFPIEINVFDIIYYNGKNLMNKTLKERREILESIIKEEKEKIVLTKKLVSSNEEEIEKFYKEALNKGNEGIMIKNLESKYVPGRYVNGWVKIKPVLESLDLVIVKAEWGEGKRANWLSSFTLACKHENKFLDIGKVGTGIKEKGEGVTFKELTKELKKYILEERGKTVILKPVLIVEVSYEEIQKSPSYSSGYALRFPRVLRIRSGDKSIEDINNIDDVKRIYNNQKKK